MRSDSATSPTRAGGTDRRTGCRDQPALEGVVNGTTSLVGVGRALNAKPILRVARALAGLWQVESHRGVRNHPRLDRHYVIACLPLVDLIIVARRLIGIAAIKASEGPNRRNDSGPQGCTRHQTDGDHLCAPRSTTADPDVQEEATTEPRNTVHRSRYQALTEVDDELQIRISEGVC
jgi:hypothetical protein